MINQWHIQPPQFYISITGGAKDLITTPTFKRNFGRGLRKVSYVSSRLQNIVKYLLIPINNVLPTFPLLSKPFNIFMHCICFLALQPGCAYLDCTIPSSTCFLCNNELLSGFKENEYMHTHTRPYAHTHNHTHMHAHTHTCMYTHAHTYPHTCTHTHAHTHPHTCTHAHTHTSTPHTCTHPPHTHAHTHPHMHTICISF